MLTIVGTIKLDSQERLAHFSNNLHSMEPIAHLLSWHLNVAGRYGPRARVMIEERWPDSRSLVINDDESSAYSIMRMQLETIPDDAPCFYWLEDHWFVCQNVVGFLQILDEFAKSEADVLTVSHLTCSWEQKSWLPVISYSKLRNIYRVDRVTQERVWAHHPGAYAAGIPMICKKRFAADMLAHCRRELENTKKPALFELPPHKAKTFLEWRGWNEFVPTFHVFREVFRETSNSRAILWDDALRIIEERGD